MKALVTLEDNRQMEIDYRDNKAIPLDEMGRGFGVEHELAVSPIVVPGEPLVLGTQEGCVEDFGKVKGVVYR